MRRRRVRPPAYEDRKAIDIHGVRHTYWVAPPIADPSGVGDRGPLPLLVGLHGLGSSGSRLTRWTGLDVRGPGAGFLCVFPDALGTIWDDHGCGRRDRADDPAFIAALMARLVRTGAADPERVVLTGVSSGAMFVERLARTDVAQAAGIALVTGTARPASQARSRILSLRTAVLLIVGTADLDFAGDATARSGAGRAQVASAEITTRS
jgi:polyhydroxybutyrate depolymerase